MGEYFIHLREEDYPAPFPASLDAAPAIIDKRTYFDDWIYNRMTNSLKTIQQTVIDIVAQEEE